MANTKLSKTPLVMMDEQKMGNTRRKYRTKCGAIRQRNTPISNRRMIEASFLSSLITHHVCSRATGVEFLAARVEAERVDCFRPVSPPARYWQPLLVRGGRLSTRAHQAAGVFLRYRCVRIIETKCSFYMLFFGTFAPKGCRVSLREKDTLLLCTHVPGTW